MNKRLNLMFDAGGEKNMGHSARWLVSLTTLMIAVLLGGCMQKEDAAIPKEGDIVTWQHNSQLIIKAKLGQRREHVITDPRIDHLIYEPEYERFIGQFPIDYVPERFPKFTETERIEFEAEDAKKIHAIKSMHQIEFNLMLDGATAKATDVFNNDNENQVKVTLEGLRGRLTPKDIRKRNATIKEPKNFVPESLFHKYGLTCYYSDPIGRVFYCYGESSVEGVAGVSLLVPTEKAGFTDTSYERLLSADYYVPIMGGVRIKWQTHFKNWEKWRGIDAAIWRLLDAWNIAPVTNTAP